MIALPSSKARMGPPGLTLWENEPFTVYVADIYLEHLTFLMLVINNK